MMTSREFIIVDVFAEQKYSGNQLNSRMFAEYHGIREDPATGSANSCLAGYLVKHRYFKSPSIDVCVEQGYEINRSSRLYLKAEEKTAGQIQVQVGGKVKLIAQGQFV
jgi:trans-2,3-dihydro-3-hydroxyanthranilate isomerase